jgi:hypothetical protein
MIQQQLDKASVTIISSATTLNELGFNKSTYARSSSITGKIIKIKSSIRRSKTMIMKDITKDKSEGEDVNTRLSKNPRTDIYGNPISKENKIYKVTFRDRTSNKALTDVVEIQSYKNQYNDTDGNEVKITRTHCRCECNIM